MKNQIIQTFFTVFLAASLLFLTNCVSTENQNASIRFPVDTFGFAHKDWQVDSILSRINITQDDLLSKALADGKVNESTVWKTVISPHDDYSYVGYLYPAILSNIKAQTIILIGVAHKAKNFGLENQIIFDSYDFWQGPYGKIKVSDIREEIISGLPANLFQVNDEMQRVEHSVEALAPFLQNRNRNIEIVSILVPYMSFERMTEIAAPLAKAVNKVVSAKNWQWGKDYAFAISTDAVHYGDEEWGGKNFAYFGTDDTGYRKTIDYEYEIINNCLTGPISAEKIRIFTRYTVMEDDFKAYKWTWCGRYSVPMGLLTSFYLQAAQNVELQGRLVGYANSIDHPHIKVDDLQLGTTANAHQRHWVGYAAVGYE